MRVALLGERTKQRSGFSQGQALAEKFYSLTGYNPSFGQKLGNSPLVVAECSPGIKVRVDDPLKDLWLCPGEDAAKWLDEALQKSIDIYDVVDKFLRGDVQLRSTVWMKDSGREVQFLTNKPYRCVITVRMDKKGDYIALKNLDGFPYVVSRGEVRN